MTNVYTKLNALRKAFHALPMRKTGVNQKFNYFQLNEFVSDIVKLCDEHKVYIYVKEITKEKAVIHAVDCENPSSEITMEVCSALAKLPAGTEIQGIGATITYMRRYAWMTFLEIAENDIVDSDEQISAPVKSGLTPEQISEIEAFGKECISFADYPSTMPEDILVLREKVMAKKGTEMFNPMAKTMKDIFSEYGWSFNEALNHKWEKKEQLKAKSLLSNSDDPFGGYNG